jgi:hypothetical protein
MEEVTGLKFPAQIIWFFRRKYFTSNPSIASHRMIRYETKHWWWDLGKYRWWRIVVEDQRQHQLPVARSLSGYCIDIEPGSNKIWVGTTWDLRPALQVNLDFYFPPVPIIIMTELTQFTAS